MCAAGHGHRVSHGAARGGPRPDTGAWSGGGPDPVRPDTTRRGAWEEEMVMDKERRNDGSDAAMASDVEGHANLIGSVDPDEPGTEVEGHASRIRPSDEPESEVEGHASRIRPSSPD